MVKVSPGQPPLDFDPPRVRKTDPETSRKAASNVKAGTVRALILNALSQGNLATYQIAIMLNKDRDSISPHMKPLEDLGLIRRTGQTIKRPQTNQECEVWEKIPTI